MHIPMRGTTKGNGKTKSIEAFGFHSGAHGIDPVHAGEQIEAKFIQDTLREKEEPLRKLHALEAKLQQVRKERPEAETVWQKVRKELGDTPPPYFHAIFMAFFGVFALVVDALILAPSMDMIGIADRAVQYVVAAGFAMLFTAWFELASLSYMRAKDIAHKAVSVSGGCVAVVTLICWGLLRGHQLRFAAATAASPLADFLGAHPFLEAAFFTLITLAAPMVGACALLFAWRDFSDARNWRRVRDRYDRLRNAEIELPRQVQAQTEWLVHFDRRKDAECREWKEIFNHYYDRGQKNGARRESLWSVIWKSALGTLGGTLVAVLLPHLGLIAECLLPVIPGLGLFLFFNHRRLHLSEERLLAHEITKFAVIPELPLRESVSQPPIRLLTKGDE